MEQSRRQKLASRVLKTLLPAVLLLLVASPWLVWQSQPERDLKLVILDKTVPVPSYREHSSLIWSLNHLKVRPPAGHAHWLLDQDYTGYYPPPEGGPGGKERLLTAAELKGQDILFIADTYGVYSQDLAEAKRVQAPDYSRRYLGGIQPDEASAIEAFAAAGGTVIGEFNTFATPTLRPVRARMEQLFGMHWLSWAGRYFEDLGHATEVPAWAHRKWKAQTGKNWDFKGPGWLVDHEDSGKILVLRLGTEVNSQGLRIFKRGEHPLSQGVDTDIPFYFWFDVHQPLPGTEVLAEFEMDLTSEGRKLWQEAGLPARFPALSVKASPSLRVYLAGDASDTDLALGPVSLAGRQRFESLWRFKHFQKTQAAFFWELYLPLLENILTRVEAAKKSSVL